MKRILTAVFLLVLAFPLVGGPGPQTGKKKVPCKPSLAECPDEGCGTQFDPNLNRRKNVISDDQTATLRSLTWMKSLADPENFQEGDTREELIALGEGQKITVMTYLLVAKPELGGESCNCELQTPAETDNHLVLVTRTTVSKFPLAAGSDKTATAAVMHSREKESQTAEFTPRVRLTHPNFTREKMQPLIDATPKKALLVRVTGLLLFDSEHFLRNHLVRVNNWEIHPVLKMEFCTTGETCKANSDTGWQSSDE
jgi:hypothetical protein